MSDDDRTDVAQKMGYESVDSMIQAAGQYEVDDYIISNKVLDFLKENANITQ